jgi:hypothetical protein
MFLTAHAVLEKSEAASDGVQVQTPFPRIR